MNETLDQNELETLIRQWEPADDQLCIEISGLQHHYGLGEARKQVLFDNNLRIGKGEIVIMTGPSGSGKTTLLTLIGSLRSVQEGSLRVLGEELNGMTPEKVNLLRKHIGFIFQAHNLFESLTAFQNVRMACELVGMTSETYRPLIEQTLTRLGLGQRIHYKPKSLSGGQKQRVAIARGLVHSPRLILADEPTAALDAESGREVVTMFQEMASENQTTILIVTHDNRILDVADRIVNMVDGSIRSNVSLRRTELICKILSGFQLFGDLQPRVLADVADKLELRSFAAGAEIIRQGEIGQEFFMIGQGQVEIVIDGQWVNTLGAGSFFGEVSLIRDQPRNATVRAATDVICFILDKQEFQEVIKASASFEQELRKALFERQ